MMPQQAKVIVSEVSISGQLVEKEVDFDRTRFVYNPTTKQLLPIARPPAVEIALLRDEVSDLKARLEKMEEQLRQLPPPKGR